MIKIKFIKIKKFFQRTPGILTQNIFLMFLCLLILALFIGVVVFYFCVFLVETSDEIDFEKEMTFKIDEESHQRIISQWRTRDRKFLEVGLKNYPDIFRQSND